MGKFIFPNQGAFLQGQWIAENTVVAQEIVHKIRKHRSKHNLMLLKGDMKKAYDRLEWGFLSKVLDAWGFSEGVQRLIHSCVSTVQYSLLLNGGIAGSFTPS